MSACFLGWRGLECPATASVLLASRASRCFGWGGGWGWVGRGATPLGQCMLLNSVEMGSGLHTLISAAHRALLSPTHSVLAGRVAGTLQSEASSGMGWPTTAHTCVSFGN